MKNVLVLLFSCAVMMGCGDDAPPIVANNGVNNGANNGGDAGNNGANNGANNGPNNGANNGADADNNGVNNGSDTGADMAADATADASPDLGPSPDPVATAAQPVEIASNFQFTEGPRWFEGLGVLRFTDIPANTIYELTPPDQIVAFTDNSMGANGLAELPNGDMLAAEHGGRVIARYSGNTRSVMVADFNNNRFNSPNDIVLSAAGMYFTDPPYGLGNRPREINFNGLFYYDSVTQTVTDVWMGDMNTRPNGVVLSPNGDTLYLADTANNEVLAFDVQNDGTLSGERDFLANVANPDGMAVDVYGNVYITQGGNNPGIRVIAGDGVDYGTITLPVAPANVAFGGPNADILFVTARTQLFRINMQVEGIY